MGGMMVTGPTSDGVGATPEPVLAVPLVPLATPEAGQLGERPIETLASHATPPGTDLQGRAMRRAQAALEVLFEHNPQPTLVVDLEGRVGQSNFEARLRFGERFATSLLDLVGSAAHDACREALSFVSRYGRPAACSVVLAQGGQRLRARFAPGPGEGTVMVAFADLTPTFEARRAAAQAQEEMAALVDALPEPALVVAGGWVLWANPASRTLVELAVGPEPEHPVLGLVHAADRAALAALVPEDGGEPPTRSPIRMRLRAALARGEETATEVPVEVSARAVIFAGLRCTLLVLRDLRAQERLEAHLAQADRLAAVGTLVAGVAHEVNNPLTFIVGNLDLLRDALLHEGRSLEAADHLAMIDEAIEGARRVAAIVSELKTIHQVDDAVGPVAVDPLVARTLSLVRGRLGTRALLMHAPGGTASAPLTARGNPGRLEQVLLNLLLNAVQAMPAGRGQAANRVWVRTWQCHVRPDRAQDPLWATPPGLSAQVCIEVADNGRGIAPELLPRLFEPFFTTRASEGGTGLGLSVSANLVERMGGWLEASSDSDGTRFVVHLPMVEGGRPSATAGAAEPPWPTPAAERSAHTGSMRILLVDDEPGITTVIARALRDLGPCEVATSGREAIARLSVAGRDDALGVAQPDYSVVLCDWLMADGNGRDVYTWLAARRPDLLKRLVFITGAIPPGEVLPQAGGVVQKPISLATLRAVVVAMVAGASPGGPPDASPGGASGAGRGPSPTA